MRYHYVINGYAKSCQAQVKEQTGFAGLFLEGVEQGETYIFCQNRRQTECVESLISGDAVLLYAKDYSPEAILHRLDHLMNQEDIYLFGSDFCGAELCVRAAARKNGCSAAGIHAMSVSDIVKVKKMIYSNHMEGTFLMKKTPYCISIARGAETNEGEGGSLHIADEMICDKGCDHVLSRELIPEEEISSIEDAKVVIAAGRGAGNKENIDKIQSAAEMLGGEMGVSRPAAMNAWAPMSKLIGVSGAMVHPDICIAAGVSGAAAFYAGIEKSKFIVAVNKDENAPIMKKADVAVADDFLQVLESLKEIIEE